MELGRFSIGIGDRFGRQGAAQLAALRRAREQDVEITPVWNKSFREHTIIGTRPDDVRAGADACVSAAQWTGPYFVDADHVGSATVDGFIASCDFFTIDVADYIGGAVPADTVNSFVERCFARGESVTIAGIETPFHVAADRLFQTGRTYLRAIRKAGAIYRRIRDVKGDGAFVTEVSMDETIQPQTPLELYFILAMIAGEGIPVRTIAPKFSGAFLKGIDYVGVVNRFAAEFEQDVLVVRQAVRDFGLPDTLKISVHSGSDKHSLYGPMAAILKKHGAGVHLKTAGTTWLAELAGLASSGGEGLAVARAIYAAAFGRIDEMCAPYAAVIRITRDNLPSPMDVDRWSAGQFASALRNDRSCPRFNPDFRQLLHVGYKAAADMGERFYRALESHAEATAREVTDNLYRNHVEPLFLRG